MAKSRSLFKTQIHYKFAFPAATNEWSNEDPKSLAQAKKAKQAKTTAERKLVKCPLAASQLGYAVETT